MADEGNLQISPSRGSPQGILPKVDVPRSSATETNTMTHGDLDRLRETCSFPIGVQTRIPGKGKTVLSASSGEVAFYEAAFPAGLRCLYTLLKGPGSESGWLYFKARPGKNVLKGAPSNVKGWKRRFFFISREDWEFHPMIPREERDEERFLQVFEKIGGGHFKILVILNSRTFYKYFAPGQVEVYSSGGCMAGGEVGGEAEGDIRGESAATADHASESSHPTNVSRLGVPSREGSIELAGFIEEEMLSPHASVLDAKAVRGKGLRPLRRLKLSELAKVVAQKAAAPTLKGVVAPLSEAKKTKIGIGVHDVPARPPDIPGEGSSVRRTLREALGPQASVMASAATVEKILAGVILPADKEKGEKLTFDQVVTKFLHVLGQGVILGSSLAVCSRDFAEGALNQRALAESSEMEMVRAQNRAIELEGALVEEKTKGKKVAEEIKARNEVVAKLEVRVAELEKIQNLAKGRIITVFKESNDFIEAVRGSASSYFGDGYDFCKRQLAHQYPNLGLDLEGIEMDHDLLTQEEIEAEKRAAEDEGAAEEEGTGEARLEKNLLWGSSSNVKGWKKRKSCNKLPALTEVEAKRMAEVLDKVELGGYFDVLKVLGSRTFNKHFAVGRMEISSSGRDNITSGDEGEFCGSSHEDSVEYLEAIRGDVGRIARRAFPEIPDKTLLRWLGGKVKDSFANLFPRGYESSSDSRSESMLDSELPLKLRSYAMSAQVGASVPIEKTGKKATAEDAGKKGDHAIEKGGLDSSKGKEAMPLLPPPKRFKSNKEVINATLRTLTTGTSFPGDDLGFGASIMSDASVARRLLNRVIPPTDKEKSQEHLYDIDFQMARADSAELELVKVQNRALKVENRLAEMSERLQGGSYRFRRTYTYFSEGFEFCKRQLLHQFPNLGVDVANMEMDPGFAEEEEATKEGEEGVGIGGLA
ncbi:hypothetical protein Acr_01g0009470 [Actinidia rufa]|uniref:Uncharacterized protein n=1 Tax=Actinidia rufa TaxID=165716 RepID=A0A7J0E3V3_9ERIC|nr:hypothetical protein Acr_01g0009470 [Actinidia rufa]